MKGGKPSSRITLPLAFKAIDVMKAWINGISKSSEVILK